MTGKIIRFFVLFVLVLSFSIACSNNNGADPGPANGAPADTEGPSEAELISMGESLYDRQCARCHGPDGRGQGGTYPALAGDEFVLGDPDPVIDVVVHGRNAMPAFGGELNDEQIAAVVSYIRNAWGNDASAVSPSDVEAVR